MRLLEARPAEGLRPPGDMPQPRHESFSSPTAPAKYDILRSPRPGTTPREVPQVIRPGAQRAASASEASTTVARHTEGYARPGEQDPLGCIRVVDPNSLVQDGLVEWLMDYKPITYGQLEALKKAGLPRPKIGS